MSTVEPARSLWRRCANLLIWLVDRPWSTGTGEFPQKCKEPRAVPGAFCCIFLDHHPVVGHITSQSNGVSHPVCSISSRR